MPSQNNYTTKWAAEYGGIVEFWKHLGFKFCENAVEELCAQC